MGIFSWIFPSEADHVRFAREKLRSGDALAAWRELEGLGSEDARALALQAKAAIVRSNLDLANQDILDGGYEIASERVELASRFSEGRFDVELRDCRKRIREARANDPLDLEPQGKKSTGPLGRPRSCSSGSCGIGGGEPVPMEMPSPGFAADPIFSLPPDDPRVRFAMMLEACPDSLRAKFLALGPEFAQAVLLIEDGNPREANLLLAPFAEREPAARFHRGLAALESGFIEQAEHDLRAFVAVYGHVRVSMVHSAAALARILAARKRGPEAILLLQEARAQQPAELELLAIQANIEESIGEIDGAERSASELVRKASRDLGAWKLLARIKIRKGERKGAMVALDTALSNNCKGPGKCGSQPLDVQAARMLAQLYLEDRLEAERAEELLQQISDSAPEADWIDGYLLALRARNRADPDLQGRVESLGRGLEPEDPRRRLMRAAFEKALST